MNFIISQVTLLFPTTYVRSLQYLPEDQISTAELRLMKKLMKKFQSLDDDEAGHEDDSPILRRKSGKLKRRRSKGGED